MLRTYRPTTVLAQVVTFDDTITYVQLTNGRTVSVPLLLFPRLQVARPEQGLRVEIGDGAGGCTGTSWTRICR